MKPPIIIFFFLCLIMNAYTQDVDFYGKSVTKEICDQYGMADDREAKDCMDKICYAADIPNNFELAPCANLNNCFALYKNGISYIVYDIQFFNKVKTYGFTEKNLPKDNIDWVAITILAHELGHHMCQHTTNKLLSSRYTPVEIELQADEYAGTILYKLGATLAQAQQVMYSNDVPEEASKTHPGRSDRLTAIAKGYSKYAGVKILTINIVPKTTMSAGLPDMILVEGGTFSMGSNDGKKNEKPVRVVTVNSFYINKYEVTQAQWQAVMGNNPSVHKCEYCPVENVTWDEANAFCQKETHLTGKIYRLPTEAEWEFAARGGNKSNGFKYAGGNNIGEVGWYEGNSDTTTHVVGQKLPNELGLYDMTGNVWEWCNDWYGHYSNGSIFSSLNRLNQGGVGQNPQGPSSGSTKVFRGGSWIYQSQDCSVTGRYYDVPSQRSSDLGFRPVISF